MCGGGGRQWALGVSGFYSLLSKKAISQQDQWLEAGGVELESQLSLNHLLSGVKQ